MRSPRLNPASAVVAVVILVLMAVLASPAKGQVRLPPGTPGECQMCWDYNYAPYLMGCLMFGGSYDSCDYQALQFVDGCLDAMGCPSIMAKRKAPRNRFTLTVVEQITRPVSQ
jgi:hypothetical protein